MTPMLSAQWADVSAFGISAGINFQADAAELAGVAVMLFYVLRYCAVPDEPLDDGCLAPRVLAALRWHPAAIAARLRVRRRGP
ncbi:hypothetical protein VXJ37_06475 [Arthrobacter nitrophenolicus]